MHNAVKALKQFHKDAEIKRLGSPKPKFKYMTLEERVQLLDLRKSLIDEEYKEVSEALEEFEDSVVGMYNPKTKEWEAC